MYFFVGVPDRITFQSWLEPPLGYITDYQFSQSSLVTLPGVFESFAVVEVRCTAVFIGVGCLNVSTLNHDMERPNIVLLIWDQNQGQFEYNCYHQIYSWKLQKLLCAKVGIQHGIPMAIIIMVNLITTMTTSLIRSKWFKKATLWGTLWGEGVNYVMKEIFFIKNIKLLDLTCSNVTTPCIPLLGLLAKGIQASLMWKWISSNGTIFYVSHHMQHSEL